MLKKYLPATITLEPCDEWQNVSGHNLLGAYYKDGKRWAAFFQIYASMTRMRRYWLESVIDSPLQIMERSWYTDRYCFQRVIYDLGMIDDLSREIIHEFWDWYVNDIPKAIGFIYLRVAPEMCLQRMQKRARSEECGVSLDYLQRLHQCHEDLLVNKNVCTDLQNIPVLVLDGSLNFRDDEAVQQSFIRQILDFLKIKVNIDFIKG